MNFALASLFTDHMVLQQGKSLPVWGTGQPGATVDVSFSDRNRSTQVNAEGRWSVTLQPLAASASAASLEATQTLKGCDTVIALQDVLVGEVWLCSGQSNMEWTVEQSNDATHEIKNAEHPMLRLFKVSKRASSVPKEQLEDGRWQLCSSDTAGMFSAVGYFFGREMQRRLGVPIGLICASWGGTIVEAWTSEAGLMSDPVAAHLVNQFNSDLQNIDARMAEWKREQDAILEKTHDTTNAGYPMGWAETQEPAEPVWNEMELPTFWQTAGLDFSGILWFRRSVDIPEAWVGQGLALSIGAVDKSDITYFNGEQVGSLTMQQRPDAWCTNRVYDIPAGLVTQTQNTIAVRVHSDQACAGMHGPEAKMRLSCPARPNDDPIPLSGTWRYAVEANYGRIELPTQPIDAENHNAPARLHNGMLHALIPFAMRGVIWYQGESNASRPKQYQSLFPALIHDVRRCWDDHDLAFHFVQLANYQARSAEPVDTEWARLREAQAMALGLPHTGMAVTIDVGEPGDIHPRNKQDVGLRLAYSALHRTYGLSDVTPNGPLFCKAVCRDEMIVIEFEQGKGLKARGGQAEGFAIAGVDKNFVWAKTRILEDRVEVWHPGIAEPKFVRYGWDDDPACNLYNDADLPASPFRTDTD